MPQKTHIQWCDRSSNFVYAVRTSDGKRGWTCRVKSPCCTNCYAQAMNLWVGTNLPFDTKSLGQVDILLNELELADLRRSRNEIVFVNDMTDSFDWSFMPQEHIRRGMDVLESNEYSQFLLLTKCPANMAQFFTERWENRARYRHIWHGTSVGCRRDLHWIDDLRQVPSHIRFLSVEPLIEDLGTLNLDGISWVIIGGESGNGARELHVDWVRRIIRQCKEANVRIFVKQMGSIWAQKHGRHDEKGVLIDTKGGTPEEWSEDLRIREWPDYANVFPEQMAMFDAL